jgi:hypothetical protein
MTRDQTGGQRGEVWLSSQIPEEPKSLETSHAGIIRIGFEGLSQHCDFGRHPCFNESRLKHNPRQSRSLTGVIG